MQDERNDGWMAAAVLTAGQMVTAGLLTIATWCGGDLRDSPAVTPKDVLDTYRRMLRDVGDGGGK